MPPKTTSSIRLPRRLRVDCSPSTQRMASTRLDLPEPLGPTIAVIPLLKSSRVLSGKDLKPWISRDFRYNATPPQKFFHIQFIVSTPGELFNILKKEKSRIAKKRSGHGDILVLFCEFQLIDELEGMFGAIHQIGGIVHKQSGQTHTALLANLLKGGIIVPHLQELTEIAHAGGNVDIDKAYIVLGKNLFHRGAGLSKGAAIQNNFTHKRVPPFNYQCNQ